MDNRTTSKAGRKPRKLIIDIDLETLGTRFETEGFSGPTECRKFSQAFENLAGAATTPDEDTPEARKTTNNVNA